jgi:catecholate siderophore receptor
MKTQHFKVAAAAALALSSRYGAVAQTTTNALEKTIIEGVPVEESVIPTIRPINSVYGTDRSIIDTPRNVTIISREQLDAINIFDVRDFSKLTSSSYTRSNFGAPTTPDIRGQIADTFVNGMRVGLTSNGNGMPVNFNSVESVNIVKGPASAVYGPSQYVGGYIDYQTKKPYFDSFHGEVSATVGMYEQRRWTADAGGPVNDKLAYRISYSGEQSGSYYYDGFRRTQAGYAAITWLATDNYTVDFNNEFLWANYTENFGINRPTQNLIDNGLYQTGININNGAGNPPSDPQNSVNVTSGFPVVNVIQPGPLVPIDRRVRLLRPGDDSEGVSYNAQVIQTLKPGGDWEFVNNSFFRYVRRETLSSYYYSEIIDPSVSFENRIEARYSGDAHSINTGASVRYQQVRAFNDFFNEPAGVWDITRDRNFINFYNSANFPNAFTSQPVPGWPNRYFTPSNGDSGVSKVWQIGPYWQHDWKATDKLSFLAGVREDIVFADYYDPSNVTPGNPPFYSLPSDNTVIGMFNANVSAVYKFRPTLTGYATYNWSQNPAGAVGNGGGYTTQGGSGYTSGAFHTEAELIEVGTKYGFLDNHAFFNVAVFNQKRADVNSITRQVTEIDSTGFETELNLQPNRNFYITLGYSYIDAMSSAAGFDVGNTTLVPASDRFFSAPPGDIRRQGAPQHLFNLLTTYKLDCGFGATANIVATGDIWNNNVGTIIIPAQYTLDVTFFYERPTWDARVMLLNVTDEKNWGAPNGVYGNESIIAELPFRLEGRVTYKF